MSKSLIILLMIIPVLVRAEINRLYDNNPIIIYSEANFDWESGLFRESERKVIKLVEEFGNSSLIDNTKILQADIDLILGNYKISDEALDKFIRTRKNSPLVPIAAYKRGLLAFDKRDFESAASLFENAAIFAEKENEIRSGSEIDLYPELAHQAYYWEGVSYSLMGRYQEAVPAFENCSRKYPDRELSDDALFAQGQIAEINRKYDEALVIYRKIGLFHAYSNTYLASRIRTASINLILREYKQVILMLENIESTLNEFEKNDTLKNKYENQHYLEEVRKEILYLRAEGYNMAGNYEQALFNFKAFLETFKESKLLNNVRLGAGWALLNLERYKESIEFYDLVIHYAGEEEANIKAIAQLYRAVAFKRDGYAEQAKKELTDLSVLSTYPFIGQVLLELGQIQYEEKDYELARRTLERADREAMDAVTTTRIQLLLGATYMEHGLYDKAAASYSRAEEMAQNSSEIFMPSKNWYISEAKLKQGISLVHANRSAEAIPFLLAYIGSNESGRKGDEAMFWLSEAYYRSELLQNAIETYSSLNDIYPNSKRRQEALYGLGWSYFRMKQFTNSSQNFDRLIREFPNTKYATEVLTRQGDGYFYIKNYGKAADAYKKAAFSDPTSEEGQYASYQLSYSLYKLGRYEQAISSLLDFVRKYSDSKLAPYSLYLIGWIRFQQKNYNEAIDDFQYLVQAFPQSGLLARVHYAIADCYYNQEKYEEAMNKYKFVVLGYPSNPLAPEAMKSVQQCLLLLGREEEAAAILDTFIVSNTNTPYVTDFKWKRIDMFYSGGKYTDAVNAIQSVISENPKSPKIPEAVYWMAKSYANMGENEKAIGTFNRIRKEYPDSEYASLAMLEEGLLYKKMANMVSSDSVLVRLQELYPQSEHAAQAGFERAIMKYNTGDTASSIAIYRTVADSFPANKFGEQSRYRLARYYLSIEFNDSARAELKFLAESEFNPGLAAEALYRIGQTYLRDEDYEMAMESFLKVRDNYSGYEDWFSLSLLALGEAYEHQEEWLKAREVYQSMQALRPEDEFGKTAASRLKRIKNNN